LEFAWMTAALEAFHVKRWPGGRAVRVPRGGVLAGVSESVA
jgi:hypothetical protein